MSLSPGPAISWLGNLGLVLLQAGFLLVQLHEFNLLYFCDRAVGKFR